MRSALPARLGIDVTTPFMALFHIGGLGSSPPAGMIARLPWKMSRIPCALQFPCERWRMEDEIRSRPAKLENAAGDKIAEVKARIAENKTQGSFILESDSERNQIIENATFVYFATDAERYRVSDLIYNDGKGSVDFKCEKM